MSKEKKWYDIPLEDWDKPINNEGPDGSEIYGEDSLDGPDGSEIFDEVNLDGPDGSEIFDGASLDGPDGSEIYGEDSLDGPDGSEIYSEDSLDGPDGSEIFDGVSLDGPDGSEIFDGVSLDEPDGSEIRDKDSLINNNNLDGSEISNRINLNNIPRAELYEFAPHKYVWKILRAGGTRCGNYVSSMDNIYEYTEVFILANDGRIYCEWSGSLHSNQWLNNENGLDSENRFYIFSYDEDCGAKFKQEHDLVKASPELQLQAIELEKQVVSNIINKMNKMAQSRRL